MGWDKSCSSSFIWGLRTNNLRYGEAWVPRPPIAMWLADHAGPYRRQPAASTPLPGAAREAGRLAAFSFYPAIALLCMPCRSKGATQERTPCEVVHRAHLGSALRYQVEEQRRRRASCAWSAPHVWGGPIIRSSDQPWCVRFASTSAGLPCSAAWSHLLHRPPRGRRPAPLPSSAASDAPTVITF